MFAEACGRLKFKSTVDLYATSSSHMWSRYIPDDVKDVETVGVNALSRSWSSEGAPYICPPLATIPAVLEKINDYLRGPSKVLRAHLKGDGDARDVAHVYNTAVCG